MNDNRARAADLHHRRLPLYLIGAGFFVLRAAEVWVRLR